MNEYDYFIGGFLSLDAEYLRQLILGQALLSPTYSSMSTASANVGGVDGFNIAVFFTAPLSGSAQTVLDGIMSGYMTSVTVAKMKKLTTLNQTVQDYIEAHYPLLTRLQLLNLYNLAKWQGVSNRASYIKPGLDWLNSVLAYALSASTAIQALSTYSDVTNYIIDVAGNVSADPVITLAGAIAQTGTILDLDGITSTERTLFTNKIGAVTPSASTPSRSLDTTFTPSSTQGTFVCYTIRIVTGVLTTNGSVELRSDTSSPPTTVRGRVAVTFALVATSDQILHYFVPAGHNVRLVSSGNATISIVSQTEVTLGVS